MEQLTILRGRGAAHEAVGVGVGVVGVQAQQLVEPSLHSIARSIPERKKVFVSRVANNNKEVPTGRKEGGATRRWVTEK